MSNTTRSRIAVSVLVTCLQSGVTHCQLFPPLSQQPPSTQPGSVQQQGSPAQQQPFLPPSPYQQLPATTPNQTPPQFSPGQPQFVPQQGGYPYQGGVPAPGAQGGPLPNAPRSNPYANLPAVTIREFRSSVPEVGPRGAIDMFMTALIKTRKFRVLERARMTEGIAQERLLNQQGQTTGEIGQSKYVGAGYIFEATVSEASSATESNSIGITIMGMGASRKSTKDTIAIDVRVIDIESGVVLDAIDVRKDILGEETSVGGFTTALANVLTHGQGSNLVNALAPDDSIKSARQASVDSAVRAAIEEAVGEIAKRFGNQ